MYCRECGSNVSERTEICPNCGVRPLNGTNYCQNCGSSTNEKQELCTNCGSRLILKRGVHTSASDDPSGLVKLAACCFPIVGLILYFVWKDEKPRSAKAVCKWALIGFFAGIILYILAFAIGIMSELMYYY